MTKVNVMSWNVEVPRGYLDVFSTQHFREGNEKIRTVFAEVFKMGNMRPDILCLQNVEKKERFDGLWPESFRSLIDEKNDTMVVWDSTRFQFDVGYGGTNYTIALLRDTTCGKVIRVVSSHLNSKYELLGTATKECNKKLEELRSQSEPVSRPDVTILAGDTENCLWATKLKIGKIVFFEGEQLVERGDLYLPRELNLEDPQHNPNGNVPIMEKIEIYHPVAVNNSYFTKAKVAMVVSAIALPAICWGIKKIF